MKTLKCDPMNGKIRQNEWLREKIPQRRYNNNNLNQTAKSEHNKWCKAADNKGEKMKPKWKI